MLEAIGIGELDERVYRALVDHPGASLAQLADSAKILPREARTAVAALEAKGLVSRSPATSPRFHPAPPEVAVEVLILRRQEELERARLTAAHLADRLRAALDEIDPRELVQLVSGQEAFAQRFEQLQRTAKREVLIFDRPPYAAPTGVNELEIELLERRVRYRVLYDREALEMPGAMSEIETHVGAGEEVRLFERLPMKLAIADRHLALVPVRFDNPTEAALLLHASPLLDALAMFFETLWERAMPMHLSDETEEGPVELSPQDRHLLALLSAGFKDRTIARQLDLGLRTVERRVRRLMQVLGAETRFQAGMLATARGWLTPPAV